MTDEEKARVIAGTAAVVNAYGGSYLMGGSGALGALLWGLLVATGIPLVDVMVRDDA